MNKKYAYKKKEVLVPIRTTSIGSYTFYQGHHYMIKERFAPCSGIYNGQFPCEVNCYELVEKRHTARRAMREGGNNPIMDEEDLNEHFKVVQPNEAGCVSR